MNTIYSGIFINILHTFTLFSVLFILSSCGGGSKKKEDAGCTQDCGASILISEISSGNSAFDDEDGDSPDWFELKNAGTTSIDLQGWAASDNIRKPSKWIFPTTSLLPGEHIRVWASGKDRYEPGIYRTLVDRGDIFSYFIPEQNIGFEWTGLNYVDSDWSVGPSGFGYGDGDDTTEVNAGTTAIYLRKTFTIEKVNQISELWLDIDFDDAFIAYINGQEIARANMDGDRPDFDATPIEQREATIYQSGKPQRFSIEEYSNLLNDGLNVLAIEVHNISESSSDLSAIPFLTALFTEPSTQGVSPPDILGLIDLGLHTNFKLAANSEILYLFDKDGKIQDSLDFGGLLTNTSIGKSSIDNRIIYFEEPTPGDVNSLDEFQGIVSDKVSFSHPGGKFEGANVELSSTGEDDTIYFTTDSSIPTERSAIYDAPIPIDGNTVIRARIYKDNFISSRIASRTFLPDANHTLPLVTLISEVDNFFDETTGIYVYGPSFESKRPHFGANFWQDWEREVHFSFYEENGTLGIEMDAGIKIFGAWSRANDQRSLSIFARGRYGTSEINYPFFPDLAHQNFKSVNLRNSGNDWLKSMMRDVTMTSLMDNSHIDKQAFRSSVVYLNAEYWGLYHMRQKVNEDFLSRMHQVDSDEVDLLQFNGEVVEGTNVEYKDLMDFISENSLAIDENYQQVIAQIDLDNYLDYQVAQIYFDNQDWPGNNIKFWKSPKTKWRWILFDTDFGFGAGTKYTRDTLAFALEPDGTQWPNPAWSTFLLRSLVENEEFTLQFINRFLDHFNTRFSAENVVANINRISENIRPEMPNQFYRWSGSDSISSWENQVAEMKIFANNRIESLTGHIRNQFGLSELSTLTVGINTPTGGSVKLNSLTVTSDNWSGEYFNDIPLRLIAQPNTGYEFSHWVGASAATNPNIQVIMSDHTQLEAVFKPLGE